MFVCVPQTLAVLPDQDSFYDLTDSLEQLGMETIVQKHLTNKGAEPDLRAQFTAYEVTTPAKKKTTTYIRCVLTIWFVCCRRL